MFVYYYITLNVDLATDQRNPTVLEANYKRNAGLDFGGKLPSDGFSDLKGPKRPYVSGVLSTVETFKSSRHFRHGPTQKFISPQL